ncbi:MAG: CoA-binding protein [Deltaproteobacteria bacterium]|nr:CoA-binding protein [Deltaproteobacteria bacterium]
MTCEEEKLIEGSNFERIFYPRRIAIIGVSPKGFGFGSGMLLSLLAVGYEGNIYPVNPKGGEFAGLKIYKSVDEIPGQIDFAIIAVPAHLVPGALEACRKKGAAGAEILSAGFKETGSPEGIALEEEIKKIAKRGIKVIGPNCFGIYCPKSGLTLLPGPDLSRESGPVAFLAQSGGMSIDFAYIGKWMGIRFNKMVSFGNGADLREAELLEYLGRDPETRVISMYIEGVEDGKEFFRVLKDVAAKKPVIVYKGGLSDAGRRAVASHTASLGGDKIIWESLLRQCNAIQVKDLLEMAQTSLAFSLLPQRVYKGISVTGGGGALGVSACDAAEAFGLVLPPLEKKISDKIMEVLPKPGSSATNPIDAANPHAPPHVLKEALLNAGGDKNIDLQILIQLLHHYKFLAMGMGVAVKEVTPYNELADAAKEVVDTTGKPVVLVLPNYKQEMEYMDIEELIREARRVFLAKGIPVFDDLKDALRAIAHVSNYYARNKVEEG